MPWTQQRLLAALLNAGSAYLLLDTLIEHRHKLGSEPLSWVPPMVALAMAAVLCIVWLRWTPALQRLAWWAMWLPLLAGVVGFLLHNGERAEHGWRAFVTVDRPPMLAPLAFAGLGAFGLVVFAKRFAHDPAAPMDAPVSAAPRSFGQPASPEAAAGPADES